MNRWMKRATKQKEVIGKIHQFQGDHPDMGLRELYFLIQPQHIGRDAFELPGKKEGLGVKRLELDRTVLLYNSAKPHSSLERMPPQVFEKILNFSTPLAYGLK
ncbi:MAG: hypothetical protein ACK4LB_14620 [Spirosomataceae bacterium]